VTLPTVPVRLLQRAGIAPALAEWMSSVDNLFCVVVLAALAISLWLIVRLPAAGAEC
jgi:hypothetical protein